MSAALWCSLTSCILAAVLHHILVELGGLTLWALRWRWGSNLGTLKHSSPWREWSDSQTTWAGHETARPVRKTDFKARLEISRVAGVVWNVRNEVENVWLEETWIITKWHLEMLMGIFSVYWLEPNFKLCVLQSAALRGKKQTENFS